MGWTVRVGLGVLVFSGLDPLGLAARVPGWKKRLSWWSRCWKPAPFPVTLLHLGYRRTELALPQLQISNPCLRS